MLVLPSRHIVIPNGLCIVKKFNKKFDNGSRLPSDLKDGGLMRIMEAALRGGAGLGQSTSIPKQQQQQQQQKLQQHHLEHAAVCAARCWCVSLCSSHAL